MIGSIICLVFSFSIVILLVINHVMYWRIRKIDGELERLQQANNRRNYRETEIELVKHNSHSIQHDREPCLRMTIGNEFADESRIDLNNILV
ncbi:hypothetical protein WR25_20046 [Diploscapter pachys]|uniref:Uncharacterized protein n=1 Tax=Diploscapter pachys TaxID=2018661 RepID=A0A2A2L4W1_9BILA|nr:hypothetical protein WR25_20046 [Diploscapter pachys]